MKALVIASAIVASTLFADPGIMIEIDFFPEILIEMPDGEEQMGNR